MKTFGRMVLTVCLFAVGINMPAQNVAGIGVVLGKDGDNLVVRNVLSNSPAAISKAINPGDRIVSIGSEDKSRLLTRNMKLAEAVHLLRGPKGAPVYLTVVPKGEDESKARSITLIRKELDELNAWGDGLLLPPGTKAPNFQMVTLPEKQTEYLTNYAGKIVVLDFWATWCGPCQESMAKLQEYSNSFLHWKDRIVLIAASVDQSQDVAAKHLQAKGWDKTHNVWVGTDAIKAYHIDAIPTTCIIDQQGRIVRVDHQLDIPAIVNRLMSGGHPG